MKIDTSIMPNCANFTTPILFLIFNRPDATRKVFDVIKKIKPTKLFVVADGPRDNVVDDKTNVSNTRKIIEEIDWDCEVKKNYSETNLGCRRRVSSGIDWFFDNVDKGIIIEDDCLPNITFFNFCAELLDMYENQPNIMAISGDNSQDGIIRNEYSYYFSRHFHVWGWATWKRAWEKYDVDMKSFPDFKKQNIIKTISKNKTIQKYWLKNFNLFYKHQADSWDSQWTFALYKHQGLCIIPNYNLISNIGFDKLNDQNIHEADKKTEEIENIIHPPFIKIEEIADEYEDEKILNEKKQPITYKHVKYDFLNRHKKIHEFLKKIKRKFKFKQI